MGRGMRRAPSKCGPASWSDKTSGDVSALQTSFSEWIQKERSLFRFCYWLLSFLSVGAKIQPSFILHSQQPSFLHIPWFLLSSSMWRSLGSCEHIQLLSDYLHWWQTLSHQLSRGTQRHLICNSIPFPIQYFGSSTAPHFSSASVSTVSWSGAKFLHLIWHCL